MKAITKLPNRMSSYEVYLVETTNKDRAYIEYCEDMGYCAKVGYKFASKKGVNAEGSIWSSSRAIMVKRLIALGFIIENK